MTVWSPDAVRHLYLTSTSIAEMILRSVLVYVFLVVVLRLSGKRLLAQLSPFDFVVILILSNTLQNAILGEDNTVAGGIVFLRYSLGKFLRLWLLRQMYEGQAHVDQIVESVKR